jgi:tellurite methyltransferase
LTETDWDKKYREGFYDGATEAHDLLKRFWPVIPRGPIIDIAMGNGRNAAFLADKGFEVYGIERSVEAIRMARKASGDRIRIVCGDARLLPFKRDSADGILVFYFLIRDILGDIPGILKKGGVVIYETFLKRQNEVDRCRNPQYLLDDGELLSSFRELDLLFYEETTLTLGGKKRAVARLVGRKR